MNFSARILRNFPLFTAVAVLITGMAVFCSTAGSSEVSAYDSLKAGKEAFLIKCELCHTVQYAIDESYSEDDWYMTLNSMISNGAQIDKDEKLLIINYLTTKVLFETKCSVCHPIERPLSKTMDHDAWKTLVSRMSGKKPGHLTDVEMKSIAGFLALGYPKAKK